MRILVTGATGFLGRRIIPLLGKHEVACITRRPSLLPADLNLQVLGSDLMSVESWSDAVIDFQPDCCIHLAWEGLPDYSLEQCRRNLDAGIKLTGVLAKASVRRMVIAGSCWEYGQASGPVSEDLVPNKCGTFASTKNALHTVMESVARDSDFDVCWARIFFVYGPGQRASSLIPHLAASYASGNAAVLREPHAAQDFVYVDDAAKALVALAKDATTGGTFNVGSGSPTRVGSIANQVAAHFGRPPAFPKSSKTSGFWANVSRTKVIAGWEATTSLTDGIARTLTSLDERGDAT